MENKNRLIDAYKLEDLLRSNSARYHHKDDVIAAIAGQPTVAAVEVVHGKWEICVDEYDCEFMRCSVCEEMFYDGDNDTVAWVSVMAIDYIIGTAAAVKAKEWSSAVARQGLWHKGGMITVVIVSALADFVMKIICEHLPIGIEWTSIILPLVLAWYIVTELGSILENAVKMGAAVPEWLVKLLKASLKAVDDHGVAIEGEKEILFTDEESLAEDK